MRPRAVAVAVVAALAALALVAGVAAADETAEAEQFYRIGEKAYRKQNYAKAAKNFDEAYRLMPLPDIAFSAAQAHRLQYFIDRKPERVKKAVEMYLAYLAAVKEGGRVGDASQSLAELEPILRELSASTTLGAIELQQPTSITISVDPQNVDAVVTLDGAPVSLAGDVEVEPGEHVVRAEAKGYFPAEKRTEALANRLRPVELQLEPRPATVEVKGERGAEVRVDGRSVGVLPMGAISVAAGPHLIAVTRRGRRAWSRDINPERAEHMALDAELRVTTQRKVARWMLVGTGLFVVGTVTTGILATAAGHRADDIDEERTEHGIPADKLDDYKAAKQDRDDYRSAAYVLGGLGLTIGTAAALLYYFDTPEAAAPITPAIGPDSAGVTVTGRF